MCFLRKQSPPRVANRRSERYWEKKSSLANALHALDALLGVLKTSFLNVRVHGTLGGHLRTRSHFVEKSTILTQSRQQSYRSRDRKT